MVTLKHAASYLTLTIIITYIAIHIFLQSTQLDPLRRGDVLTLIDICLDERSLDIELEDINHICPIYDTQFAPYPVNASSCLELQSVLSLPFCIFQECHYHEKQNIIQYLQSTSHEEKVQELYQLALDSQADLAYAVHAIRSIFGVFAKHSVKSVNAIREKSTRAAIRAKYPWFTVEHIRDALRAKVRLHNFHQIHPILHLLQLLNFNIIEIDTEKFLHPKEYGWRPISVDIRHPNGLLVELYFAVYNMDLKEAKDENHKLYEYWRSKDETFIQTHQQQYENDLFTSEYRYTTALYQWLLDYHVLEVTSFLHHLQHYHHPSRHDPSTQTDSSQCSYTPAVSSRGTSSPFQVLPNWWCVAQSYWNHLLSSHVNAISDTSTDVKIDDELMNRDTQSATPSRPQSPTFDDMETLFRRISNTISICHHGCENFWQYHGLLTISAFNYSQPPLLKSSTVVQVATRTSTTTSQQLFDDNDQDEHDGGVQTTSTSPSDITPPSQILPTGEVVEGPFTFSLLPTIIKMTTCTILQSIGLVLDILWHAAVWALGFVWDVFCLVIGLPVDNPTWRPSRVVSIFSPLVSRLPAIMPPLLTAFLTQQQRHRTPTLNPTSHFSTVSILSLGFPQELDQELTKYAIQLLPTLPHARSPVTLKDVRPATEPLTGWDDEPIKRSAFFPSWGDMLAWCVNKISLPNPVLVFDHIVSFVGCSQGKAQNTCHKMAWGTFWSDLLSTLTSSSSSLTLHTSTSPSSSSSSSATDNTATRDNQRANDPMKQDDTTPTDCNTNHSHNSILAHLEQQMYAVLTLSAKYLPTTEPLHSSYSHLSQPEMFPTHHGPSGSGLNLVQHVGVPSLLQEQQFNQYQHLVLLEQVYNQLIELVKISLLEAIQLHLAQNGEGSLLESILEAQLISSSELNQIQTILQTFISSLPQDGQTQPQQTDDCTSTTLSPQSRSSHSADKTHATATDTAHIRHENNSSENMAAINKQNGLTRPGKRPMCELKQHMVRIITRAHDIRRQYHQMFDHYQQQLEDYHDLLSIRASQRHGIALLHHQYQRYSADGGII